MLVEGNEHRPGALTAAHEQGGRYRLTVTPGPPPKIDGARDIVATEVAVHVSLLLEMVETGMPDRLGIGPRATGMTYEELARRAGTGAAALLDRRVDRVVFVGANGPAFPVATFAAAWAGVPFVPLNYRLSSDQLVGLLAQQVASFVIADPTGTSAVSLPDGSEGMSTEDWLTLTAVGEPAPLAESDAEDIALVLYTSGTTAAPKGAILRHRHLTSYILGTVEFASAKEDEATLVSVPTYHIAGVANLLSNVYAGRRIVYLDSFSPEEWLERVRREGITHAMLVPTMLARITDAVVHGADPSVPTLRSIAYGGARMPAAVIERALALFPHVDFVNAYGLTESSSTIAVLGPDDHRAALASNDSSVRARLGSAGRIIPGIEIEIRDVSGSTGEPGKVGEVWVRGDQVSGEYIGQSAPTDSAGWFLTRDLGHLDADGYLFIEGRSDDIIIRGGENIAPREIEDILLLHEAVADAAVVGPADEEWGQRIAAVVVPAEGANLDVNQLQAWLKKRLRSSKTPDQIAVRNELPYTETGKLLRRQVLAIFENEPFLP
jgi:acyl-CoA synthetase (AMP-forming)/AMP-acid ligase II